MSLKSEKLFQLMEEYIKEKGGDIVPKIKSVYRFEVSEKKGVNNNKLALIKKKK
jgi:hypothetical protein